MTVNIDSKSGQYVFPLKKIMKILELPKHRYNVYTICLMRTQQRQSSRSVWTTFFRLLCNERRVHCALCSNEIKMNKSLNKCVKYAQRLMNLQLGNYCWFIRAPFVQTCFYLHIFRIFFRLALAVRVHISLNSFSYLMRRFSVATSHINAYNIRYYSEV